MTRVPAAVREFQGWMQASLADAAAVVPDLLELSAPALRRELRARAELRTLGVMKGLLEAVRGVVERYPSHAHELALIVARYASSVNVPRHYAFAAGLLQGEAWREYARTLRALRRTEKALRAVAAARRFFGTVPGTDWQIATVDLVEAPLLHDLGRREEALAVVRRAALQFSLSRTADQQVEAVLIESWMLAGAGELAAAAGVWTATVDTARYCRDGEVLARVEEKLGVFELRDGSAGEAMRLLDSSLQRREQAPVTRDAIRARRAFAEAANGAGRPDEAISEYHKVRNQYLDRGEYADAGVAAAEVVDLYLYAGRESQLAFLTATLERELRDAGAPAHWVEPFTYLRGRAAAGMLTQDDVVRVRRFFEQAPLKPKARFRLI